MCRKEIESYDIKQVNEGNHTKKVYYSLTWKMLRRLLSEEVKATLADGWNPSDVISNPSGYFLFKFNLRVNFILPLFKVLDFSNRPIAEVNFSKKV